VKDNVLYLSRKIDHERREGKRKCIQDFTSRGDGNTGATTPVRKNTFTVGPLFVCAWVIPPEPVDSLDLLPLASKLGRQPWPGCSIPLPFPEPIPRPGWFSVKDPGGDHAAIWSSPNLSFPTDKSGGFPDQSGTITGPNPLVLRPVQRGLFPAAPTLAGREFSKRLAACLKVDRFTRHNR
jgi:hypothetical protein